MNKAELEKKSLSELHTLAAEAGVERYRMLPRAELVAKLSGAEQGAAPKRERSAKGGSEQRERPARRRRRSGGGEAGGERKSRAQAREPKPEPRDEPEPEPPAARQPAPSAESSSESSRPRRRRRRRFGRRGKEGVTLQGLLLPPAGRQALLAAESREGCTTLLRGFAADLTAGPKGPDPVALLIDPSPEELADWRREAPQAEIVAAGQARHADDALAQAKSRAAAGEDVILLVDSLTRLGEAYDDAEAAKKFFDAAGGRLTVVAALERPASG